MKGWKETLHANGNRERTSGATLLPAQIDFMSKTINKSPEDYFVLIKVAILKEVVTIINRYI